MYGHVITKFSRMGSLPHSFTHGAPLRDSRARAPLTYGKTLVSFEQPLEWRSVFAEFVVCPHV